MTRARTMIRTIGLLGAAALTAAGCGGGDTPPADAGAPAPDPAAAAGGTGTTVAGTPAVDPVTGQPIDPAAAAAAGGATTSSVPVLSGDDIGGGLGSTESTPLFVAGAVPAQEAFAEQQAKKEKKQATAEAKKPKVTYAGAKIYVDGIVHDVDIDQSFPEGNPVFRLLSVTGGDLELELIAGEFTAGGGSGVLIDKGELVSLVNASEQITYRVKYMRAITSTTQVAF